MIARHLADCLANRSHNVQVATDEQDAVVGYVAIHWLPYLILTGPEGFDSELFVLPAMQGQGIGTKLLETAITEARSRGCCRLQLLNMRDRASFRSSFYPNRRWRERTHAADFVYPLA